MSKQSTRKPLSIALGAAAVVSLGAAGIANAEEPSDIFTMDELSSGYLIAGGHEKPDEGGDEEGGDKEGGDKEGEGKCGEGKCGSS